MNYNKDIQRDISSNNQGQSLVSFKESLADKEENNFFSYVSKKTEKVVTALYMVTDLMDDTEPIKDKLRRTGVDLLSETHSDKSVLKITMFAESIISFIKLASSVGLISEMNQGILDREFFSIVSELHKHKENKKNKATSDIFGEGFFGLTEEVERLKDMLNNDNGNYNGQTFINRQGLLNSNGQIKDNNKDMSQRIKDNEKKSNNKPEYKGSAGDTQRQRDSRRREIIDIIKAKKAVTIRDISAVIFGVSEKTLQRELVSLVAQNVLKKEGQKRWSRYSLN